MIENEEINIEHIANKCVGCITKPCQMGCPLNNDTTEFIKLIKQQNYKEAFEILSKTTVLTCVCGRICPHEKQCQGSCAMKKKYGAVEIGKMESFIGDEAINNNWDIKKINNAYHKEKIAIVGAGPSGLTCAAFLSKNGYQVTIYEKHEYLGGLLYHGIPEFRLDKTTLKKTIDKILKLGIKVNTNCELGTNIYLKDLEKEYDAIFLGFGANVSRKMNIPGENLKGVYGGNELLENKLHPNYKNKKVAVIGGGNVAMDTARTIKKLGADEVTIIYRRSEKEMPAEVKEIEEAKEENIKFLFQTNPIKIIGKENVEKIECVRMKLEQKEHETRLSPVEIPNSNFTLDMDYIVMAVGSKPEDTILSSLNLEINEKGYLKINKDNQTSNHKIFAGGDLAQSRGTVAWASRSGRNAAYSIMTFLENKSKY